MDYLIIGHITEDLQDGGFTNGGTASYSALTARAFGLVVGVVTAGASDLAFLTAGGGIQTAQKTAPATTTFRNIETPGGRKQYLLKAAPVLTAEDVPDEWRAAKVVHLGPVAQETDPSLIRCFPRETFIGMTPQGCMRAWDDEGLVRYQEWKPEAELLNRLDAAVISLEDVRGDEETIADLARRLEVLAVTEGAGGARVYWRGDVRRFGAPRVEVVDPTGPGDIFAAAFFIRLQATRDPWQSAQLAVKLASLSVTRRGLDGIPTPAEVQAAAVEILQDAVQS